MYVCDECGKSFKAYYCGDKLSHTIPKATESQVYCRLGFPSDLQAFIGTEELSSTMLIRNSLQPSSFVKAKKKGLSRKQAQHYTYKEFSERANVRTIQERIGEKVMEDVLLLIVISYSVALGFGHLLQKYLKIPWMFAALFFGLVLSALGLFRGTFESDVFKFVGNVWNVLSPLHNRF